MKILKLIIATTLIIPNLAAAEETECHFKYKQKKSFITINKDSGTRAQIKLKSGHLNRSFKDCIIEKDELGKVFTCNTPFQDMLIYLEPKSKKASGQIMSKTLNLHAKINC
ncbi:MAG: hypothetical protein HON90_09765 [Halobacteriovoraceae bacterium]|jgi:hypothetical protein|nr:hypothetical protein [Halobacteriovoraceae bacterium]